MDQQRALTAQQKKELAEDYYRLYAAFLSRFKNDSACFYICKRAALDTTNVDYQLQAGQFVRDIIADKQTAKTYFERAYRICESQYNELSGQLATTTCELGLLAKQQGKLDEALIWYQRSLSIREKIRGKNSPAVAELLNNLGELYRAKKDLKNTMDCHKRALKIREKHFAANSLQVAESKNNIAGVYAQQKQWAKAEALYKQVQSVYAANDQTPKRRIADNLTNLAVVAYMQNRFDEALLNIDRAYTIYTQVLGTKHPQTLQAHSILKLVEDKHKNK